MFHGPLSLVACKNPNCKLNDRIRLLRLRPNPDLHLVVPLPSDYGRNDGEYFGQCRIGGLLDAIVPGPVPPIPRVHPPATQLGIPYCDASRSRDGLEASITRIILESKSYIDERQPAAVYYGVLVKYWTADYFNNKSKIRHCVHQSMCEEIRLRDSHRPVKMAAIRPVPQTNPIPRRTAARMLHHARSYDSRMASLTWSPIRPKISKCKRRRPYLRGCRVALLNNG